LHKVACLFLKYVTYGVNTALDLEADAFFAYLQTGGGILNIVKSAAEYVKASVSNATKAGMKTGEWVVRGWH
jgi:hypothetical protein